MAGSVASSPGATCFGAIEPDCTPVQPRMKALFPDNLAMNYTVCTPVSETHFSPPDPAHKMPGHWLLARLGKRVLRPGGLGLTRIMLDRLGIGARDEVVEFAPAWG